MTILHFPGLTSVSDVIAPFVRREGRPSSPRAVSISCADCVMRDTSACDDCVVTHLCDGPTAARTVHLTVSEAATVDLFAMVGLAPRSQHQAQQGSQQYRRALTG